jgi:gliding motility-associated-like protein
MRKSLFLLLLLFAFVFAQSQVNLNSGLRAYYPFTGNANDISGNNNNPVFNNAVLTADHNGNPNSAYHFNGTNSYMKVLNNSTLNMTNQMSIALWVKPTGWYTGSCYNNMMVMKGDNDNNPTGNYYIRFSDFYTGCTAPTTTQERFYGTGVTAPTPIVQLNQWYSVVWTYDGTTARIYVNCVLQQSFNISLTFTNAADLFLGHMNDPAFPYWLNGDLDEVRIYDRPLNQQEVNVLGGCTTTNQTCNNWLNLPSFQSYVNVGDLDIPGNQITVEAVFNRTTPYSNGYNWAGDLVSKHQDPANVNYLLRPNNAEITTSNGYFSTPAVCDIQLNKTYHVAMTYDGTTLKFYRNGFLMSSVPATGTLYQNNYQTRIGLYEAGAFNENLIGYINEVRIWNVAKTQSQIQSYMNSSLPSPSSQPGLQAYYIFNDLQNKQGNAAWNGTLGGPATINATNPSCSFIPDSCAVPLTCNNWLSTPSYQSYASIGDLDITGNKITVEAVVNRTQPYLPGGGNNTEGDIVSKHNDPLDVNYLLRPNHAWITTSNGLFGTPDICPIQLNKTYHVAMVYDGSTLKFYRDGFLMSQIAATGNLVQNNWNTRIGLYDAVVWSTQMLGYINEVRIWNTARTQNEIKAYMNTVLPNPTTQVGLQAYYTFNSLVNKQGNAAWNATLGGSASINATNTSCAFVLDTCPVINSISGIINNYTPVISLDVCKNKITVEDATSFQVGDTVLMIQMKGAVIDSTNSASFGTITDYRNSGNYEFNYIKAIAGNTIEFSNSLTRQYDLPGGKVQLIRVPYYQNVNITSALTCLPWDGSKGGVLVLNVSDSIILNSDIDVSGKGFRGGIDPFSNPSSFNCYESQYYYPANPDLASGKGEGIADISASKSFGRGAIANGGGGGNSHNAGGGGGSNASVGGFGGYNFEGTPCNTTVPYDNRGIGGKALTYSSAANKIFMGGGGGAGHSNNPEAFQSVGGNGSGIIILISDKLKANGHKIIAKGNAAIGCANSTTACHEGMGGGGGGGTILLKVINYLDPITNEIMGGSGANMTASGFLKVGPGGGGSGGKVWVNSASLPGSVTVTVTGGLNGVCTGYANDPWGATQGQLGSTSFNLNIPVDNAPFKANIDSVRIKDSAISCSTFDFKGFGYTNTNPVSTWQWYFGDGNTANTQNTSHTYATAGTYTVKLIVTDINGCKDSLMKNVTTSVVKIDFTYQLNACNPLVVQFNAGGTDTQNPYWTFGDGNIASGITNVSHTYASSATYQVSYSASNGVCADTLKKTIDISIQQANIIATNDTTICLGATKQLIATASGNFCWTPITYLSNPTISNPITSTPQAITYYYTAEITGSNLIANADFNGGNTGFTSQYTYSGAPNTLAGQYFVGPNPQAWNATLSACSDHTTGTGNMLIINGDNIADAPVWKQTIAVTPNTNYVLSTWLESVASNNPAQLQFSVNGNTIGNTMNASNSNCNWQKFQANWNSGSLSSIQLAIVNKNITAGGNDFALDDIFFGTLQIKKDSVKINVDTAKVNTIPDAPICQGNSLTLTTTGNGTSYSWTPSTNLNNAGAQSPIATPVTTTQYFVTATTAAGCTAKDSVTVTINAAPVITISNDTTICQPGGSAQLFATGGGSYAWTPSTGLSNTSASNPVASPVTNTTYIVTVTGANTCSKKDSVDVNIRSTANFAVNNPSAICSNGNAQLIASGGDLYSWTPASGLNNPNIANPIASPSVTTPYSVQITDTVCHNTSSLQTTVSILPAPLITATRSNDVDCTVPDSHLQANGGVTYSWSPASTLNNANIAGPVATPLSTTEYTVTGTDNFGCTNTGKVTVKVDPNTIGGYLMPSAFTPNNDGHNDCFGIKYWGTVTEIEFSIFNRWGERVFYSTQVGKCWDGTYKGVPQDPDVFIYMIKAKTTCLPVVFRKGTFALIR